MIEIPLRNRRGEVVAYALIDDADARLCDRRWSLSSDGYVVHTYGPRDRKQRLHREVMDAPDGLEVDHIDGDPLNNRRSNLRLATRIEQTQNQGSLGRTSRYRGVHWVARDRRWRARVTIGGTCYCLGDFKDEDAAGAAARAFRLANMPFTNEARSGQVVG